MERTDKQLEKNVDRISVMEEHLKNVQQELKYTQARVSTSPGFLTQGALNAHCCWHVPV